MKRIAFLAVLAVAACSPPHEPVHFRDKPADYAALGLTDTVAVREDGRRSRPGSDDYEWWYLDGVAADGTVVVVVFSDNWLVGSHRRTVGIDITPPDGRTRHSVHHYPEPGSFATDRADVRIGAHRFAGDLARYTISVAATEPDSVGCELTLVRRVPSYRPGTGFTASGDDFFAWVVAVPEGALTGTITYDGKTVAFSGSGYHDHNWGNLAPWFLLRNWWWGRAEVDGKTVVMSEMRPAKGWGDKPLSLLYVAGPDGVVTNAHGDDSSLVEGAATANDDPRHPELRAESVTLRTKASTTARFARQGSPLTSLDLLADSSRWARMLARIARRAPWYTRWRSTVTLTSGSGVQQGPGTIEFMDFD